MERVPCLHRRRANGAGPVSAPISPGDVRMGRAPCLPSSHPETCPHLTRRRANGAGPVSAPETCEWGGSGVCAHLTLLVPAQVAHPFVSCRLTLPRLRHASNSPRPCLNSNSPPFHVSKARGHERRPGGGGVAVDPGLQGRRDGAQQEPQDADRGCTAADARRAAPRGRSVKRRVERLCEHGSRNEKRGRRGRCAHTVGGDVGQSEGTTNTRTGSQGGAAGHNHLTSSALPRPAAQTPRSDRCPPFAAVSTHTHARARRPRVSLGPSQSPDLGGAAANTYVGRGLVLVDALAVEREADRGDLLALALAVRLHQLTKLRRALDLEVHLVLVLVPEQESSTRAEDSSKGKGARVWARASVGGAGGGAHLTNDAHVDLLLLHVGLNVLRGRRWCSRVRHAFLVCGRPACDKDITEQVRAQAQCTGRTKTLANRSNEWGTSAPSVPASAGLVPLAEADKSSTASEQCRFPAAFPSSHCRAAFPHMPAPVSSLRPRLSSSPHRRSNCDSSSATLPAAIDVCMHRSPFNTRFALPARRRKSHSERERERERRVWTGREESVERESR